MAFLELLNVDKSFGGVKAVHNFTLTVQEGELVGLIGPNGAGKTTVFNLITGLYPVDNGQIFFQGEDLSPLKSYDGKRHNGISQMSVLLPRSPVSCRPVEIVRSRSEETRPRASRFYGLG